MRGGSGDGAVVVVGTDGIGDGVVEGRQAGEHDQVEVGLVLGHVVQQEPGNVQHVHQPATPPNMNAPIGQRSEVKLEGGRGRLNKYMKWRVVASITGAERMRCWARVLTFT